MVTVDNTTAIISNRNNSSSRTIRLRSMPDNNGVSKTFELSETAASISEFVVDCLDLEDEEDENATIVVDIPRISGDCLGKVVEFMTHYEKEELKQISGKPLRGSTFNEEVTQKWYRDFLSDESLGIEGKTSDLEAAPRRLMELHAAGNFLGIERLLDLVVLKIAYQIMNKDKEGIRVYLSLPKMTKKEEEQVRKDKPWIFEN